MQTMHLVLPVGAHDWEDNPLGEAEFRTRIKAAQAVMDQQNWSYNHHYSIIRITTNQARADKNKNAQNP